MASKDVAMRRFIACLLVGIPLTAQIWPESWHGSARRKVEPAPGVEPALWAEYGGEASEKAVYSGPVGKFSATAYRLKDATSALALYQALRPANAVPVRGALAVSTTPGSQFMAHENYVLVFQGWRPLEPEMKALYAVLPQIRAGGGLPTLVERLPVKGRVRNSERYLLGIDSLTSFVPQVPPAMAGFEEGAEAMAARYVHKGKEFNLLLLEYPTPPLARRYEAEFKKRQGWNVRRSGPYVGLVPDADAQTAAPVLDQIQWQVHFTWNEATKFVTAQDVGQMMMAIFELAGFLLVVCVGGGLLFAGLTMYMRRRRTTLSGTDAEATFLRLD